MKNPPAVDAASGADGARVVVGVDGSENALVAVEWAAADAARRRLPLRIVSCYSVPFYGEPGMIGTYAIESQVEAIKSEHEGFVHTAIERAVRVAAHLKVDSIVTLGSPTAVLPQAVEHGGELVVGAAGRSGRLADVIGSTATAVCHHTAEPVVVVRAPSSRKGSSMKKIVVGTDGSECAAEALRWAYEEARLAGASLVVLHSWQYPYGDLVDGERDVRQRMQADASAQLADAVRPMSERAEEDGVALSTRLVEDLPAKAIIEAAADADLVVVGSRGRGGFTSMLLGSVSRSVVQHAPCPVAVIRQPAT